MHACLDKTSAMEGKDGVLAVSIGHCFPDVDVAELSRPNLAVTDGDKTQTDHARAPLIRRGYLHNSELRFSTLIAR